MATEAKAQAVTEFTEVVGGASSVVLADFSGLDVAAVSDLRRKCRQAGVEYRVIKNTLAKRVITNTPRSTSKGTSLLCAKGDISTLG